MELSRRVAERPRGVDPVAIAAADSLLDYVSARYEVVNDVPDSTLCDANASRNVSQPDAFICREAQEHVGMVGQKCPNPDVPFFGGSCGRHKHDRAFR